MDPDRLSMDAARYREYTYDRTGRHAKIVYFGLSYAGKISNLMALHSTIGNPQLAITRLHTEFENRVFWDGITAVQADEPIRYHLYMIPGAVLFESAYVRLLMGVDGIIFVADSNPERMQENKRFLRMMEDILISLRTDRAHLPVVLQYNKRDLVNAVPIDTMNIMLNQHQWPVVESCAAHGTGVVETFRAMQALLAG